MEESKPIVADMQFWGQQVPAGLAAASEFHRHVQSRARRSENVWMKKDQRRMAEEKLKEMEIIRSRN
jgi:hypothetical protein